MASSGKPAIFLDKDGTLIPDLPYNVDPGRITLNPGVPQALALLAPLERPLVVVSNQSGVARGLFCEAALQGVRLRLAELFATCGATLAGFYYCPHHPEGTVSAYTRHCACRKPAPGLLLQAATELNLSLEHSWMVGNTTADVAAGLAAGCCSILMTSAVHTWHSPDVHAHYYRAPDMMTAAGCITATLSSRPLADH